ncbi:MULTISPECIES: M48 family metalloprotease [Tenacibaculum]|uniref:M48 family metalloprotease n=1 Tax=Tenacibaculum TaxID=104267 RepID=UPI001F0B2AB5|nr:MULTISPECIES: M48 family metalloprotease [Tenacibaculum]MCH3881046.1 M48 family metalloprotease [Tenacibaculum aquimarinum]MCH3884086.1 M48 family metalloprotease [Tenacibaculum aquimarinum]MDO6599354.1 M48 family metalloprotease [Tenacibaculum sp. 1_MG-2023]
MRKSSGFKIRLLIGVAIVAFAYLKKCSQQEINAYTGKKQAVSLSVDQEIAIGLQQAPSMAQQHGGLYPNDNAQKLVDQVGAKLINNTIAKNSGYNYEFHLLRDDQAINAFALPGGQCFITYALFSKLKNEDQLAGVLGHEIGHVLGKHSNERITDANFWKLLTMGASVGADLGSLANGIGQQTLLKNGRGDELESDELGVKLMIDAGYNPEELIGVMEILKAAAGPNRVPEFQSSHPDPENRIEKINEAIAKYRR